jgi:hypothetical protein
MAGHLGGNACEIKRPASRLTLEQKKNIETGRPAGDERRNQVLHLAATLFFASLIATLIRILVLILKDDRDAIAQPSMPPRRRRAAA